MVREFVEWQILCSLTESYKTGEISFSSENVLSTGSPSYSYIRDSDPSTLRDNTTFQLRRMSFQFLQRRPPLARLETFAVGQDTGRPGTAHTCPATYIAIQIQDICDAWDILMSDSKRMMSPIVGKTDPYHPYLS